MTPPDTFPEQALLRAHLERQAAALAPVAASLRDAVAHPPIAPHDWHGPASQAYAELEARLRQRVAAAGSAAGDALHSTRSALGQLGG